MRQNWDKFRALSSGERALLLAAWVTLPLVRAGLRLLGFRRLCRGLASLRLIQRPNEDHHTTEITLNRAFSTARLVRIAASRGIARGNCLDQSVTIWWLLRLQGIETEIRIGVRKGTQIEAHAWVELDSVVVNDRADIGLHFPPFAGSLLDLPIS